MKACSCGSVPDRKYGSVRVLNVSCEVHGEPAERARREILSELGEPA